MTINDIDTPCHRIFWSSPPRVRTFRGHLLPDSQLDRFMLRVDMSFRRGGRAI